MILHCGRSMTESSSIHCFTRCFTRCFGFERHPSSTKTTLEPMQNGFSHLEEEKENGTTMVVKLCEPNSNGYNTPIRTVGQTTCCVPINRHSDELPYTYEAVPTTKAANGYFITQDKLSCEINGGIDISSDTKPIITNSLSKINQKGGANGALQSSNGDQTTHNDSYSLSKQTDLAGCVQGTPEVVPTSEMAEVVKIDIADVTMQKNLNAQSNNMKQTLRNCKNSLTLNSEIDMSMESPGNGNELLQTEPKRDLRTKEILPLVPCNGDIVDSSESNLKSQQVEQENGVRDGEHDILYFKNLVNAETTRLNDLIRKWEKVLAEQPEIHEEVRDEIRSVTGQTHLVISERFKQFKSLMEESEQQTKEIEKGTKTITLTDLQGFWDMIYYQVQDVITKFQRLDKIQSNAWNHEILHEDEMKSTKRRNVKKPTNARKKGTAKTVASQSSNISEEERARRLAARKRLAEARKKMAAQDRMHNSDPMVTIL